MKQNLNAESAGFYRRVRRVFPCSPRSFNSPTPNAEPPKINVEERQPRPLKRTIARYPAVEPVLRYLLTWLQDIHWPVARTLAPFLATIGKPLVPHIKRAFDTDDAFWEYWIIDEILLKSPEVAEEFRDELKRIVSTPTKSKIEENLPEKALEVLQQNDCLCRFLSAEWSGSVD